MKTKPFLVAVKPADLVALGAPVAASTAPALPDAPVNEQGLQMAVIVARHSAPEGPIIALSVVLGSVQIAVTLSPSGADRVCHAFADAVLWQNDQLRQKAGGAVH